MYNKNIVLNILVNTFGKDIENYVQNCINEMDIEELEEYFNQDIDYAVLNVIDQMIVENYEVEAEGEMQQTIFGTLEVKAEVDGFAKWEGVEIFKSSSEMTLELLYEFHAEDRRYKNLYLEYLY